MGEKTALCELKHLHTAFRIKDSYYDAVDDVDLTIYSNEVLAIVGESGCGDNAIMMIVQ